MSGIAATFFCHPLDTVKLRFQVARAEQNFTMRACMKNIWMYEGVSGFFKGVISNLAGRTPITAILFGSREWANRRL